MTPQPIIYREQDIEIALTTPQETVKVPGFVAEGIGLGYYIDKAPGNSSESIYELATGLAYQDYYVPVHLASGCQFGWRIYTEQHLRTWLEQVAPLIDWALPTEQMALLPEWKGLGSKIQAILNEVIAATKEERAGK